MRPLSSFSQASYLFFALNGGAIYSDSPLAAIWKEYAKADVRWGVFDPTVVSLGAFPLPRHLIGCVACVVEVKLRS